jgi:uncharacterized protein (TIGR01777 family)
VSGVRVAVTGATGTIGRAVCAGLLQRGDQVVALTRDAGRAAGRLPEGAEAREWRDPLAEPAPADALAGADAVVHLLGEPIDQRWTDEAKRKIRESRVLGTRNLVAGLRAVAEAERPGVLVSQSASGYYGARDGSPVDETAGPGDDFLARVVVDWEAEARKAEDVARVVMTRTGVVVSPSGGALARMLPFFRLGVGGPVAGGRQYVPWVHLDDVAGALLRCLDDADLSGPVNVTAPEPATNAELGRALGRVLHRPAVLPVPGFAVRTLYGEMAWVVTTGVRAVPARLEEAGYGFRFRALEGALRDVLA